ncbi:MAG: Gfo/Idh/MocA family oxidoreductase [Clostridiales bacterium]|jgi:predicted dehydrogenase|nr:Gfo/Idh/MocA family oxidoreductase [Clostridiales bacterium]
MFNLGIIGFGGMANHHYDALKSYDRLKIAGVYDVDPKRGQLAEEKGLKSYPSKEALLADDTIDIVLVAATNEVHKDLSIEAMRAGKHVICEKPVTLSSAELEEVIAASEQYGRIFTVDQNRRTNKDFVLMRRNVEQGLLGDVYVIESRVEGSRGMPKGWRTMKDYGGGMMLDWGVHLIDQIMYMTNEKVVNVFCKMYSVEYSEVDDNFRLTMTFGSGLTAHIEVSTNNYITHPRWYVLGKQGTLQIDGWECDGKIVRCVDKENVWVDEIIYTKAGPTKTMAPRNKNSTEEITLSEPTDVVDNLTVVYDGFLDAIEGKAALKITPQQALRVMKVMEAAFESHQTASAVQTSI